MYLWRNILCKTIIYCKLDTICCKVDIIYFSSSAIPSCEVVIHNKLLCHFYSNILNSFISLFDHTPISTTDPLIYCWSIVQSLAHNDFLEGWTPHLKGADALTDLPPPQVRPAVSAGVRPVAGGQPMSMVFFTLTMAICTANNFSLPPLPLASHRGLL